MAKTVEGTQPPFPMNNGTNERVFAGTRVRRADGTGVAMKYATGAAIPVVKVMNAPYPTGAGKAMNAPYMGKKATVKVHGEPVAVSSQGLGEKSATIDQATSTAADHTTPVAKRHHDVETLDGGLDRRWNRIKNPFKSKPKPKAPKKPKQYYPISAKLDEVTKKCEPNPNFTRTHDCDKGRLGKFDVEKQKCCKRGTGLFRRCKTPDDLRGDGTSPEMAGPGEHTTPMVKKHHDVKALDGDLERRWSVKKINNPFKSRPKHNEPGKIPKYCGPRGKLDGESKECVALSQEHCPIGKKLFLDKKMCCKKATGWFRRCSKPKIVGTSTSTDPTSSHGTTSDFDSGGSYKADEHGNGGMGESSNQHGGYHDSGSSHNTSGSHSSGHDVSHQNSGEYQNDEYETGSGRHDNPMDSGYPDGSGSHGGSMDDGSNTGHSSYEDGSGAGGDPHDNSMDDGSGSNYDGSGNQNYDGVSGADDGYDSGYDSASSDESNSYDDGTSDTGSVYSDEYGPDDGSVSGSHGGQNMRRNSDLEARHDFAPKSGLFGWGNHKNKKKNKSRKGKKKPYQKDTDCQLG